MNSIRSHAKIAYQKMLHKTSSVWKPIAGDICFLLALGFIGGAIGRKIESLLITAGASIARQSQGADAVQIASQDSALLWQALWLHLVFVIVVYVLFCIFAMIGWRWALQDQEGGSRKTSRKQISLSIYIKRFFALHAFFIPCAILVDALGFWAEYEGLVVDASILGSVLRVLYIALVIILCSVSIIGSVKIQRLSPWYAFRQSVGLLRTRQSMYALCGMFGGALLINGVIGIASMLSAQFSIIIGIGLLFPYLAYVRLFAAEVFA